MLSSFRRFAYIRPGELKNKKELSFDSSKLSIFLSDLARMSYKLSRPGRKSII
jgi:hypothetical protein